VKIILLNIIDHIPSFLILGILWLVTGSSLSMILALNIYMFLIIMRIDRNISNKNRFKKHENRLQNIEKRLSKKKPKSEGHEWDID